MPSWRINRSAVQRMSHSLIVWLQHATFCEIDTVAAGLLAYSFS